MARRARALAAYAWGVSAVGCALLVAIVATGDLRRAAEDPVLFGTLLALVLAGEARPVTINRRGGRSGIQLSISTPFVFAMLLTSGTAAAAVALAVSSSVADVLQRKPVIRTVFNAAQYTISLVACGAVLHLLAGGRGVLANPEFSLVDLGLVLAAGGVFFVLNSTLPAIAVALDQGLPPTAVLRRDFGYQLGTAGVLTSIAPVIVVAADHSLYLLPMLLLPAIAVHWSAHVSLQNERQSLHDGLTGLPNRVLFSQRVADALAAGAPFAVLLVDLDHFKEVNDTLGHKTGDGLLVEVAARLRVVLGDESTVARLGGDEFAVLIPVQTGAVEARGLADRVCRALDEPFDVDGFALAVGASVGIALYPEDGDAPDALLRCADVAMYVAKGSRTGVARYRSERDEHSRERLVLMSQIRDAIDAHEFVLHYQPKLDLRTSAVVGVEALVRWQHPDLGLLAPGRFIALVERSVHEAAFTAHVVACALAQVRRWRDAGLDIQVSVNVPANGLHAPGFADKLAGLLAEHGVPAAALELEITESTIMADRARATTVLRTLSGMGIRLAIDDFGTGYSSLAYLKQLPVHTLKIDRSFVMNMATDEDDEKIVRSTVGLAKNLGLQTVAEGIEDPVALDVLRDLGCELGQGYYIGRPVPPDVLDDVLTGHAQARRIEEHHAVRGVLAAVALEVAAC